MTFKEFAINYLNPVFVVYRIILLIVAFYIFILAIPLFTHSASRSEFLIIIVSSFIITIGLYMILRAKAYILYLLIPIVFVSIALTIRGGNIVEKGVMSFPMILCFSAAFLVAFNGFRPWGTSGLSINDINKKLDEYNS